MIKPLIAKVIRGFFYGLIQNKTLKQLNRRIESKKQLKGGLR